MTYICTGPLPCNLEVILEPIAPQPGSALNVTEFVGRHRTTSVARSRLLDGVNLALTDPRRMGKTYWLKYFCATTQDFSPVLIDYEGVRTREEFLLRTAKHLSRETSVPTRAKELLKALFEGLEVSAGPVKIKPGLLSVAPTQLLADTVMAVNEHATGKPVLVCMDEVPLAIRNITNNEGPQAAREVLQTLRDLQTNAALLRWIVCGSVGFHHVLRQCEATEGDINQLDNLPLGPLVADESRELAHRLLLGVGRSFEEGAVSRLAIVTGGMPFLMHKVASLLMQRAGMLDAHEVGEAFDDFVADRDESRSVTHFLTRLDNNYGADAILAGQILDKAARASTPLQIADLAATFVGQPMQRILDYLIDDHYLVRDGRTIDWRYDVLRTVWIQRRYLDAP
jgi:hypothetical protein